MEAEEAKEAAEAMERGRVCAVVKVREEGREESCTERRLRELYGPSVAAMTIGVLGRVRCDRDQQSGRRAAGAEASAARLTRSCPKAAVWRCGQRESVSLTPSETHDGGEPATHRNPGEGLALVRQVRSPVRSWSSSRKEGRESGNRPTWSTSAGQWIQRSGSNGGRSRRR